MTEPIQIRPVHKILGYSEGTTTSAKNIRVSSQSSLVDSRAFASSSSTSYSLSRSSSFSSFSLHKLIENHDRDSIKHLLNKPGADPNQLGKNEWTPLHSAAREGLLDICEILIEKGADVNAVNESRTSVLDYLVRLDLPDEHILDLVKQKGGIINHQNEAGETPLHSACFRNRVVSITWLLRNSADFQLTTKKKETPLHFAVLGGAERAIELLLQYGADPSAQSDNGTCEELAVKNNHTEIVPILKNATKMIKHLKLSGPGKLLPKLRLLRHISAILGRNLSSSNPKRLYLPSVYFTLHEGPADAAGPLIYTSETIRESSNPTWKNLDIISIRQQHPSVKTQVEYSLRMMEGDSLVTELSFNLSRLVFYSETLQNTTSFPPNTVIFQMNDGYYAQDDITERIRKLQQKPKFPIKMPSHESDRRPLLSLNNDQLRMLVIKHKKLEEEQAHQQTLQENLEKALEGRTLFSLAKRRKDLAHIRLQTLTSQLEHQQDLLNTLKEQRESKTDQCSKRVKGLQGTQQKVLALSRDLNSEQSKKQDLMNDSLLLSTAVSFRRASLLEELSLIFPTEQESILNIKLPETRDFQGFDEEAIATGFGYICQIVVVASRYLGIPLRFEIIAKSSRSMVIEALNQISSNKYPLYSRGVDVNRFYKGLYLLNRNLEELLSPKDPIRFHETLKAVREIFQLGQNPMKPFDPMSVSQINRTFPQSSQTRPSSQDKVMQFSYSNTSRKNSVQYNPSPKPLKKNYASTLGLATKTNSTPSLPQLRNASPNPLHQSITNPKNSPTFFSRSNLIQ